MQFFLSLSLSSLLLSVPHLQQAVPFGVQSPLELEHVLVLLRVDVLVREVDREALNEDAHDCKRDLIGE